MKIKSVYILRTKKNHSVSMFYKFMKGLKRKKLEFVVFDEINILCNLNIFLWDTPERILRIYQNQIP